MIFTSWLKRYPLNDFSRVSGLRLFGFTHLGRADVRRLAGAQISVGGINTVTGLLMNQHCQLCQGGKGDGYQASLKFSHPTAVGTLDEFRAMRSAVDDN
jgi:hypothetical protein